jgi:O-antigen/teichoic acid export membrane protein
MNQPAITRFRARLHPPRAAEDFRSQLIRGVLGSAGIQAVSRILALVLGIVLARALGPEGYGIYAYAFAIMSLLMVVAEAGVPNLLMREVAGSLAATDWGLLRGSVVRAGQFVGMVATSVSAFGFLVLWWRTESLAEPVLYTAGLMLLVLPLSALCKTLSHALRGLHRVAAGQAIELIIRPLVVLALFGAGTLAYPSLRDPQFAMLAQLVSAATVLFVGAALLWRYLPTGAKEATPTYRSYPWLRSVVPFTLMGSAGIINHHTDIIMLGWFANAEVVGVYRVAGQGAMLVAFGLQAANAVLAPHFARLHSRGEFVLLQRLVTSSARLIAVTALPAALILVLFGDSVVGLLFGPKFISAQGPLAILAIGQLVSAGFGSVGFLLNMTGHENIAARILWQTAILNVILNISLIPFFGMIGAASATAVSVAAWNILLFREVRRRLGLFSTALRM